MSCVNNATTFIKYEVIGTSKRKLRLILYLTTINYLDIRRMFRYTFYNQTSLEHGAKLYLLKTTLCSSKPASGR